MPGTIKNCFDEHLTFDKIYNAHLRARQQKTNKAELIRFEMNLENNLTNLLNNLRNGTYKIRNYRTFYVTEPKLRKIQALPFVDRVAHQWYVEEFIGEHLELELNHKSRYYISVSFYILKIKNIFLFYQKLDIMIPINVNF